MLPAGKGNESVLALADYIQEEKVSLLDRKRVITKSYCKGDAQKAKPFIYHGLDLKVGGEGMKGFYDKMLPNEIGKYVKQWGGKVEKGKIEGIPGATIVRWETYWIDKKIRISE